MWVTVVATVVLPALHFLGLVQALLLSVNSGSASKRHCRHASEIPHTERSRNMSSKVLPKLQYSDNRLSSEANVSIHQVSVFWNQT